MHKSIMTKIKKSDSKDWIVLDVVIKHIIKIFECYYKEKNSIKNGQWFYTD